MASALPAILGGPSANSLTLAPGEASIFAPVAAKAAPAGPATSNTPVLPTPAAAATSTTGTIDPSVAAILGGQIGNTNTQLGDLGTQLTQALAGNQDSYNQSVNNENSAFTTSPTSATNQYNTQEAQTIQDLLNAKGQIATNVRQNTTALQTLLGLAGSGNSSASEIAAPYAASQAGSQQQSQVQDTYGTNLQDLDTAYAAAKQQHDTNLQDLQNNLTASNDSSQVGVINNKISLLNTLAQLTSEQDDAKGKTPTAAAADASPFLSQINNLYQQGLQYGNAPTVSQVTPTQYQAPSLSSYNYGSTGAPTATQSTATTAANAPLITTLAQKQNGATPALG